jgi:hypothetical protein
MARYCGAAAQRDEKMTVTNQLHCRMRVVCAHTMAPGGPGPGVRHLLLWCAALHAASADWAIGDAGIDHHFGIDAYNVSLASNSSSDCAAACEAAPAVCQAWVFTPSGSCGGDAAVCMLKALPGPPSPNDCRVSGFPRSAASLLPPAFHTLPLGSLVPEGWLAAELTVMANGLTGYLAEFWHDVMNSSFVGGEGDPGLHEKVPYWLNGLVPLSYLLPDQPRLAAQRQHYLGYIMEHQTASGWLGPDDAPTDGQQVRWPARPALPRPPLLSAGFLPHAPLSHARPFCYPSPPVLGSVPPGAGSGAVL